MDWLEGRELGRRLTVGVATASLCLILMIVLRNTIAISSLYVIAACAIAIAVLLAGPVAGAVTTVFAGVGTAYFLVEPFESAAPTTAKLVRAGIITLAGLFLAMFTYLGLVARERESEARREKETLYRESVAARERAEAAVTRASRLQAVSAAYSGALTPEQVTEATLEHVFRPLGAVRGAIMLRAGDDLRIIAMVGYPAEGAHGASVPLSAPLAIAEAVRGAASVFEETPAGCARFDQGVLGVSPAMKARAVVALPFIVNGQATGGIVVAFAEPRMFDPDERAMFEAVATLCSQALQRSHLYDDERRARAQAEQALEARDETLRALRQSESRLADAQRELAHQEKLSAIGTLVSGVAHEIRTPLAYLSNNAHLLERALRNSDHESAATRGYLAAIEDAVDRINRLVKDLRRFHHTRVDDSLATLGDVVAPALDLFRATHRAHADVRMDLQETAPLMLDRMKVQQVVLNLLENAVDATPDGGTIEVVTRAAEGAGILVVRDHGVGITADVQARMFEPFFTTKAEGTGLGLAIVRRVVENHGGTLRCASTPGEGTEFTITFPATRARGSPFVSAPAVMARAAP